MGKRTFQAVMSALLLVLVAVPGVSTAWADIAEGGSQPTAEVGIFATVNGEDIPISAGMVLGDATVPIWIHSHGNNYYNRSHVTVENANGMLVVIEAALEHQEWPAASSTLESSAGIEYTVCFKGWSVSTLYHWVGGTKHEDTYTYVGLIYYDNGQSVVGASHQHAADYCVECGWDLYSYQPSWYPGPSTWRIWAMTLCYFSHYIESWTHENASRFNAYPGGEWDDPWLIYPIPPGHYVSHDSGQEVL